MENSRDKKGRFKRKKRRERNEKLHFDFDVGPDVETENEDDKIFLGFQRPDTTDHQLKRFFEVFFLRIFLSRNSVTYTINQTHLESKKSCPAFLFC